jgi:dihydrofolate reductase
MVKIISAIGENGEYSLDGKLPWPSTEPYAKADMNFFRKYTLDKTVIMGYNTWLSIGKPLPRRYNVVVNSKINSIDNDVRFMTSLEDALIEYPNAIIIGGVRLINEVLTKHIRHVDEVVINMFNRSFDADVHFDIRKIPMISRKEKHEYFTQLTYFWPN